MSADIVRAIDRLSYNITVLGHLMIALAPDNKDVSWANSIDRDFEVVPREPSHD